MIRPGLAIVLTALTLGGLVSADQSPTRPPIAQRPAHPRLLSFPDSDWSPPAASEVRIGLAGGATAYVVTERTLPLVDLVVVARAGAYREPTDVRGLADFTASLLRRGGTSDLAPDDFDRRADELGAVLTSRGTMLYGAASLRCTTDVLDDAVALFLDMLEHPRFAADRVSAVKRNLLEGLARRTLDPLESLQREWEWLLYGREHFSTRPLRAADLEGLQTQLMRDFHRRYWRPENFTIAVAGDIDADRLRSLVEERFLGWQAPADSVPEPAPTGPVARPRRGLFHLEADIPQAKVAVGHRAPLTLPSAEERVRIEVLAEILGGRGAISRLNGRLRSAEGLVYRASARLDPGDLWPADYQMFFDTVAGKAPTALKALLEEVDRLRAAAPHPEELAIVKRELLARRWQQFDTAEEAAGYLVEDALVGRADDYRARYEALLASVSPEDVLDTAQKHLLHEPLTVLVVGRWGDLAGPRDADGWTRLERLLGLRAEHLPVRDPLTLD